MTDSRSKHSVGSEEFEDPAEDTIHLEEIRQEENAVTWRDQLTAAKKIRESNGAEELEEAVEPETGGEGVEGASEEAVDPRVSVHNVGEASRSAEKGEVVEVTPKEVPPAALAFDFGTVPDIETLGVVDVGPKEQRHSRIRVADLADSGSESEGTDRGDLEEVGVESFTRIEKPEVYCLGTKQSIFAELRNLQTASLSLRWPRQVQEAPPEQRDTFWRQLGRSLTQQRPPSPATVSCARLSPCGEWLALGTASGDTVIVSLRARRCSLVERGGSFILPGSQRKAAVMVEWSGDSKILAVGSSGGGVSLWSLESREIFRVLNGSRDSGVLCLAFHPIEPAFIATGTIDRMVQITRLEGSDTEDWIQTAEVPSSLIFSPDGQKLVVGFFGGACHIYKRTGKFELIASAHLDRDFLVAIPGVQRPTAAAGSQIKQKKSIWNIVFSKSHNELFVRQIRFIGASEFLLMGNQEALKLVSIEGTTLQTYANFSRDSELRSVGFFKDKVMMINGSGRIHVWNKISDFVPVFNFNMFRPCVWPNTSVEIYEAFKDHCEQFRFVESLTGQVLEKLKEKTDRDVDAVLVSVSADLNILVDCIKGL